MSRQGVLARWATGAAGAALLCAARPTVLAAQALPGEAGQDLIREYVAREAAAELGVRFGEIRMPDARRVQVESVDVLTRDLKVWRATLPSDHSHPYLLAMVDDRPVPLGGFAAPEIRRVAQLLGHEQLSVTTVQRRAETLALLADGNGAIQFVFTGHPDTPSYVSKVADAWRRAAPSDWPRDTVFTRPAEGWHATVTLLSRDTRSYTLHWVPVAYSFEFNADGALVGWANRLGESFGVKDVPLAPTKLPF